MARHEFIFQGFTARSHAQVVRELFEIPEIQRVVLSVAFVTENGVDLIAEQIRLNAGVTSVFAGIRNDITSQQGLEKLYGLGATLYTVDTGSRNILFHPKIYLVRGRSRALLSLGSANLTLGGLNKNIEAGMLLDCDLANAADSTMVDGIERALDALPAGYPNNITRVGSAAELGQMRASGLLVDEMAIPPPRPATSGRTGGNGDTIPRIRLMVPPIYGTLRRPRAAPPPPAQPPAPAAPTPQPTPATTGVEFDLVWESKPLTRRDLTIPTAAGTHATGSINLDKGLLPDAVDGVAARFVQNCTLSDLRQERSPNIP
jgi:HKD family nuclease